jgi:F0F1-type ATP synthase membrane subunit b/b'
VSLLVNDQDLAKLTAAASSVIQEAIREAENVIILPLASEISNAVEEAITRIGAQVLPAAATELSKALAEIPGLTAQTADQILDSIFTRLWRTRITLDLAERK